MVKSIYKITNKINNKVYIGQSNNVRKRISGHIYGGKNCTSVIHNAIKKYGIENFDVEILEKDIENYNEREIYWIEFYNATDRRYGYNIAKGGESPPIICGEDSVFCKISDEEVEIIRNEIANGDMMLKEIAQKHSITPEYVRNINCGQSRRSDKYKYPTRKYYNKILDQEIVDKIIYLLRYTGKSTLKISEEIGVCESSIIRINDGTHPRSRQELFYPIRKRRYSDDFLNIIISELMENKLMITEICQKYDISRVTVSRINNGKIHRIEGISYPIRTSNNRVYKTCRDYPELDWE